MRQQNPFVIRKLKQAFSWTKAVVSHNPIAEWAYLQGLSYEGPVGTEHFSMVGTHAGKTWVMAAGAPTRDFITGSELTACAQLQASDDVAVLIMSRKLKDTLEKKAFDAYTDSLQTAVDVNLPMEMRWLAAYEEEVWAGLPRQFWSRYAVITGHRSHAAALVTPEVAQLLLDWPDSVPEDVPFIFMLKRGKAYLRMQHDPADLSALEHAAIMFTTACDAALQQFSGATA